MTLWGSVIDPSQVKLYDVPVIEGTLPPLYPEEGDTPIPTPEPTNSKTIPKPTAHLPGDHDEASRWFPELLFEACLQWLMRQEAQSRAR